MYEWCGVTRQACYQHQKRQKSQSLVEEMICNWVRQMRHRHHSMGTRKLFNEMQAWLESQGIKYGRDRLFKLLRQNGLLIKRKRRSYRTTWAGTWRCPNLLAELGRATRRNQVWVADITYIETENGFVFLALITDLYTRRIMGYDISPSLSAESALRAFEMACKTANEPLNGLIHHSDHGVQYTCHAYRQALADKGVLSSMGEVGNCYDNAHAERVNGILKLEYSLDARFVSLKHVELAVAQAVWLYNHERPHLSLNMQKPYQVYINETV